MVEKLKNLIPKIETEFGELGLFAMLKMDEIVDKWSLLFAAHWVTDTDEEKRDRIFEKIYQLLEEVLTEEEGASVARIGLMPTDTHIVEELKRLNAEGSTTLNNMKINGNTVHEGIILKG